MSEKTVDLVFTSVPDTNLWQLVGIASVYQDALALARRRMSDEVSVAIFRVPVDEVKELAIIPGVFGCSPWNELPGEFRFGRHVN